MINLEIQAVTNMGSVVYTTIKLPNDYTMNQVVNEVKRNRYVAFRTMSMKRFVNI